MGQTAHGVEALFLFARQAEVDARELGLEPRQDLPVDAAHHVLRGDGAAVHLGGHVDHPLPVGALNGGVAPAQIELGHAVERHLLAAGGADVHVLQVADGLPLRLREAHHHPHVVLAALHPLRLGAVEGAAHLAGQVAQGQA